MPNKVTDNSSYLSNPLQLMPVSTAVLMRRMTGSTPG